MTILSFLLGENKFIAEPKMKKVNTIQIPIPEMLNSASNAIPALLMTIAANRHKIAIWIDAAALILSGNFPGNLPPMVNSPQGAPKTRAT